VLQVDQYQNYKQRKREKSSDQMISPKEKKDKIGRKKENKSVSKEER